MAEDDIQLLVRIKTGDYNAFEILFNRYYNFLCNSALMFVKDSFLAEDIVQEVFVKIWETRTVINITSSIKSYLFIAVKNRSLNKIQSETVRKEYSSRFLNQQNNEVLQVELEQEEFREHLYRCIQKLPPRCKDVFLESRFKEMKQEQIAAKMHISLKTVKTQVSKALRYIQNCLQLYYPEYF